MKGQTVSRYRIADELGRGGMGVVYLAEDTKLGRRVALKFLPPEASRDEEARQRFVQEARAASSLDHPNICTLYEIDETADGQLFIAMACYEGETLKERLQRQGRLSTAEALDIALQLARGLRKAHDAGIVHRDVKPANLFVTSDGVVKILDFGLAKLTGLTGLTRTGTTLGTCAYMAPEQIRGAEADPRVDLWALGVVMYEMLAGRHPFAGEQMPIVMHAVLNEVPRPVSELAPEVPARIDEILARLLAKEPDERYGSAAELARELTELRDAERGFTSSAAMPTFGEVIRRPRFAVPAGVALLAVLAAGIWAWERESSARWARGEAIPEVARLVDQGDYAAAFALAEQAAEYVPDDPLLRSLETTYSVTIAVTTSPPDADVYVRGYAETSAEWQHLGRTPLETRLPRRALRWRFEKPGFVPAERATTGALEVADLTTSPGRASIDVNLMAAGTQPPEMVLVPGGRTGVIVNGATIEAADLPPFFLDRHEVTNRAFKEFADAGGYAEPAYWEGPDVVEDGIRLSWQQAVARFVDTTGRPGPAGWELGGYPAGKDEHPVTGISWYEAEAYARYRGKRLPTVHHWAAASLPQWEGLSSLAAFILPLSNLEGTAVAPVGSGQAMGPYGTYDIQGNVREWIRNHGPEGGWVLGGAWPDARYDHRSAIPVDLSERSALTGFRLMREAGAEPAAADLDEPVDLLSHFRDERVPEPASDEVFDAYARLFSYSRGALDPSGPVVVESTPDWTKERVTIDTGYGGERMDVYLFVPTRFEPPFQPLVYFPGAVPFLLPQSSDETRLDSTGMPLDWVVKSGRILVWPVYQGSYERRLDLFVGTDATRAPREWIERRWDLGRTIDYLETRPDIDVSKLGYLGFSMGASYALPLLALEPRFTSAVLVAGGTLHMVGMPPVVDPTHYIPRITIPVLMVNGRYDHAFTVESFERPSWGTQRALFELLGTAPEHKRHVLLEAGHASLPRAELLRATLPWLDEYLGPVR